MNTVPEMIERVAKALFEISAEPENGDTWEAAGEGWQDNFRLHARVAIAVMREPTGTQVAATEVLGWYGEDVAQGKPVPTALSVYQLMIDAALADPDVVR